jgi:hypothetical protein
MHRRYARRRWVSSRVLPRGGVELLGVELFAIDDVLSSLQATKRLVTCESLIRPDLVSLETTGAIQPY